jgi:hypothetical protein
MSPGQWAAIAVGLAIAALVALVLNWRVVMDTLHAYPLLRAELAICGGALPGFLASQADFSAWRDQRNRSRLDRLLASTATVPVPPAPGYTHYLPCALLGNGNLATSQPTRGPALTSGAWAGVLYVGPAGLQFRTSPVESKTVGAGSLASPPARFDINPAREVMATAVVLSHPLLGRSTLMEPRYAMLLRWPTGQALFGVPSIGDTLPRLHSCLDTIRWGGRGAAEGQAPLPAGSSAVL